MSALLVLGGVTAGFTVSAMRAGAAATLVVTPHTGLKDSVSVTVSGSGFTAGSTGAIIECSNATPQPTVSVLGNNVPVSCTNPLNKIVTTDGSGNVPSTSFTVHTGVLGPPGTGTDSDGNPAANDAANFPCPPTAAQQTAGASCVIAFGDQANDQATQVISFASSLPPPTTTTNPTTTPPSGSGSRTITQGVTFTGSLPAATTTTTAAPTTASTPPTTSAGAKGKLASTGADTTVLWATVAGFVLLDLGYLALSIRRRPRWARQLVPTTSSNAPPDTAPRR